MDGPNDVNLIDYLSRISKKYFNQKIVLMHGGGSELLKYYEVFRFNENITLDLSYTLMHLDTSVEADIKFLMKV